MKKYFKTEYYLLVGLIICLPLIIYVLKFICNGISNDPEDWAQFGDYIGGTTNVFIGVFNIIATIILAFVIQNLDEQRTKDKEEEDNKRHKELIELETQRHEQSLELQKELFFRQTRQNIYLEFNNKFEKTFNSIRLRKIDRNEFSIFSANYNSFVIFLNSNKYFFKNLENNKEIKTVRNDLNKIISTYENWEDDSLENLKKYTDSISENIKVINANLYSEMYK